jgi:hypothetical protein
VNPSGAERSAHACLHFRIYLAQEMFAYRSRM